MTALVLKTLSDLGCGNSRWNEELHFSVDETFFERKNNPCVSSLSQKFSFPVLLSSDGGKIFFSITCIIFRSRWWEQSRPEPYLFLSTSIFAGQNDQLRLKSSKTVLKAFQLIFPWLKMKWKTLCISNLDSWIDQKKHLNKDARKKNVYEVEMCDDQLRFFLLPILLSRRPKSWIFSSSPIFDKSQISLFSWALVLDLHRLHGCREERCPCSSSNVVAKKNVWSGRRISRRAIHNYFLFLLY